MKRHRKYSIAGYGLILVTSAFVFNEFQDREGLEKGRGQLLVTNGTSARVPVQKGHRSGVERGGENDASRSPADFQLPAEGAGSPGTPEEGSPSPLYTMQDFPHEAGIHRVEVDGEILELAVDTPEDVPAREDGGRDE